MMNNILNFGVFIGTKSIIFVDVRLHQLQMNV
jgi:hypothetical protein